MSELIDTATVLAAKIDQFSSKLFLFDVVDEKYHLIASSETQTTAFSPFNDIREGLVRGIDKIETITGKKIVDRDSNLIIPSQPDGSGVDQFFLTFGFVHQIDVISMGILEDVSLKSAHKLITMTHLHEVDQFSLNDRRNFEELVGDFINKKPKLILLTGGMEQGATRSLGKLVEIILFSIRLLPGDQRPVIVFGGNSEIAKKIQTSFNEITKVHLIPNIRPSLEQENFSPALRKLGEISTDILETSIGGFNSISALTSSPSIPYSQSLGIMTRFLGKLNDSNGGVLTIHMDKEASIMAASNHDNLFINISNAIQQDNLKNLISANLIKDIKKWAAIHLTDEEIKFKLWNKTIYPNTIPCTDSELIIEKTLLRAFLQKQFSDLVKEHDGLQPFFNQIIISGNLLTEYLSHQEILLLLLDSIQPHGIASIYLDSHGILPVLGAIANENKILPVQIMESSAISLLARIFTINSNARYGTAIAKIGIEYEDGTSTTLTVSKGGIFRLPITIGQHAKITIQPLRPIDLDPFGRNLSKGMVVQGGLAGVIFDCRGRPITLPKDDARRRDQLKKWQKGLK